MLVNNENLTTIWFDDNKSSVQIIDQRELPHKFVIIDLVSYQDAIKAIKDMAVRGAPLIGGTAAWGMYLAAINAKDKKFNEREGIIDELSKRIEELQKEKYDLNDVNQGTGEKDAKNDVLTNNEKESWTIKQVFKWE